jgi:RNA polymerase sigma-70 factor (ECF subfamily)
VIRFLRPVLACDPERFFDEFHPVVFRFVQSRWGASRQDVEDLVQETLLLAWRGRKEFRGDSSALTWVLAIAKNRLRLRQRKGPAESADRARKALRGLESRLLPSDVVQSEEMIRRVRQALAQLDPDYQDVLVRRYYDGCSIRSIAQSLGESEKAVESRLARAKSAFREQLENGREGESFDE